MNPCLEDFRAEVCAFLDGHAERRLAVGPTFTWGEGPDTVALFDEWEPAVEAAALEQARRWLQARDDAGLAWITGPIRYGGRDLSRAHERLYYSLEAGYDVPSIDFFGIGLGMVAPTILAHGTEVARRLYLKAMHRGDIVGCQLFSEPGAGSDLASVGTRARRNGDQWLITGQKVWTSGAHYADIGEVLCRTDATRPKHQGLTMFVVDMHAPGVTVRPLRQLTGGATFCEVFLDDVIVADDWRLGDVDDGWSVALTTLMNERGSVNGRGAGGSMGGSAIVARVTELARRLGRGDDPRIRDALARVHTGFRVGKWNHQRAMDKVRTDESPGPELSGAKLLRTQNLAAVADLVGQLLGPRIAADDGDWGTYAWSRSLLGVPGLRLAGGTDEVQRNIIGERVLGLPKEPNPGAYRMEATG